MSANDALRGRRVRLDGGVVGIVLDSFTRPTTTRFGDPTIQYCLVVELKAGPAMPPDCVGRIEIFPIGPGMTATLEQNP